MLSLSLSHTHTHTKLPCILNTSRRCIKKIKISDIKLYLFDIAFECPRPSKISHGNCCNDHDKMKTVNNQCNLQKKEPMVVRTSKCRGSWCAIFPQERWSYWWREEGSTEMINPQAIKCRESKNVVFLRNNWLNYIVYTNRLSSKIPEL